MLKAYKYRIYPTKEQAILIEKHFGCMRFIYNLALETKVEAWKKMANVSRYDLQKQVIDLRNDLPWLSEVNAQSLCAVLLNLDRAYKNFFKGGGFPNYKKKSNRQSFGVPGGLRKIDWTKSTLSIVKIKNIPIVLTRKFEGQIKTITISRTPTGKYFASILVKTDEEVKAKIPVKNSIGIDLGLKDFIITSDGIKVDNPRHLRESMQRLKVLQKRASRKKKGSANRKKANLKVAVIHEKITNQRLDFIHKVTSKLVNDNQADTFFMEDLNVKGMMSNHKLAQAVSDVSWSKFKEILSYKCEWSGKNLILINRFAPSSKTCSGCGYIKDQLLLSEREFICNSCGYVIDRDINAAINIKNFGLRISGVGCSVEPVEKSTLVGSEKQETLIDFEKETIGVNPKK